MELYQRIEHLIDKKLPLYKTEEDEVMLLVERVNEAQRFARMVSLVKQIYSDRQLFGLGFFGGWGCGRLILFLVSTQVG